jgi:hypothetical protein
VCLRYDLILWAAIDSNVRGITIRRKHRNTTGVSQLRCLTPKMILDLFCNNKIHCWMVINAWLHLYSYMYVCMYMYIRTQRDPVFNLDSYIFYHLPIFDYKQTICSKILADDRKRELISRVQATKSNPIYTFIRVSWLDLMNCHSCQAVYRMLRYFLHSLPSHSSYQSPCVRFAKPINLPAYSTSISQLRPAWLQSKAVYGG